MNKFSNFYLSTYNTIDSLDNLINNWTLFYNGWKLWHATMRHGLTMMIVAEFSMYQELCEVNLNIDWFVSEK